MSKIIEITRELAERLVDPYRREPRSIHLHNVDIEDLRSLLAAPVVERQAVGIAGSMPGTPAFTMATFNASDVQVGSKLYTSPPAPVAVVLPAREAMRDLIAEVIGGDAYDCLRVWSAWGVGTMSEDDFSPIIESEERLYELADACLDKVKELNQ